VKLAFYTIVVIHVLAIAGFLIIGCKREDKDAAANIAAPTNDVATPPFGSEPNIVSSTTNLTPPLTSNPASGLAGTSAPAPFIPPVSPPPTNPSLAPAHTEIVEPAAGTDHTIVKGDTFATLATKYGVSVKGIQTANPGVDPTKLKIGQKVKIPPKTSTMARNGNSSGAGGASSDAGDTYTVKSGDTLTTIAKNHRTTVKELQKLNALSTTGIRVGQKLKMPPRSAMAPAAATSSGTAVPAPGAIPPAQ